MKWRDDEQDTWLEETESSNCETALREHCELIYIPVNRFVKAKRPRGRPLKKQKRS